MMFIRSFTGRKLSTYIKTSHIFALMTAPLRCPDYTCVNKRGKSVNISFPPPTHMEWNLPSSGTSTGLRVFRRMENQKVRQRTPPYLAIDANTYEIIFTKLSRNNVRNAEALLRLMTPSDVQGKIVVQRNAEVMGLRWQDCRGVFTKSDSLKIASII